MFEEKNEMQPEVQVEKVKHSGFGIASFIISIVQAIITMIVILSAGLVGRMHPSNDKQLFFMIIGLLVFAGLFVNLVGAGLGIGGVFQNNRKKVFSILGIIFNFAVIISVSALIIFGLMIKKRDCKTEQSDPHHSTVQTINR
jgi:hypothetical protein